MKENYTVSFTKDDVAQARLVKAGRGCPVEIVPDGWQPAPSEEQDTEQEQAEQQDATAAILAHAADIVSGFPARSAWNKGVIAYALELLDNLADLTPDDLADPAAVSRALLNGADNWTQYSEGGSALIYDGDIAERLCTPSELKRCKGGDLRPNNRETWLDVQARALSQAAHSVRLALGAAVKEVTPA